MADPAIWDAETGESIADVAMKHRVYFQKGDNARIPGWMQIHYRLAFDDNGFPQMYIFKNCQAFIRTLPLLQYDDQRPEDLDTDGEDHIADETRYFLMTRPIKPRQAAANDEYVRNPLHLIFDIDRSDVIAKLKHRRMEVIDD